MRISFILISFSLVIATHAQQSQMLMPLQKPVIRKFVLPATQTFSLLQAIDSAAIILPQNSLPHNFYSTHLGVACKMELKLEKGIKLPLRIRLGSKDQVDYLEGKYNRRN